jgi:hypothetical protein
MQKPTRNLQHPTIIALIVTALINSGNNERVNAVIATAPAFTSGN